MTNYNKESAQFVLRSNDLPSGLGTNSIGSNLNGYRTSMIWKNVDLKSIMGTMYDKYDMFTITLVMGITNAYNGTLTATTAPAVPANSQRTSLVNMTGLLFRNSNYSIADKANMPSVNIGVLNLITAGNGVQITNYSQSNITFQKSSPIVDLTIEFRLVYDNSLMNPSGIGEYGGGNVLPHYQLIFRVEPII